MEKLTSSLLFVVCLGAVGCAPSLAPCGPKPYEVNHGSDCEDAVLSRHIPEGQDWHYVDDPPGHCEHVSPEACDELGVSWEKPPRADLANAAALYTAACERGYAKGCFHLGSLTETGRGVQRDDARAAALYEQACNGKIPIGCVSLGYLAEHGQGVTQDDARAAALFRQGCEGGSAVGCSNFGVCLEHGAGVPPNPALALEFYKRACSGGHEFGCRSFKALSEAPRPR